MCEGGGDAVLVPADALAYDRVFEAVLVVIKWGAGAARTKVHLAAAPPAKGPKGLRRFCEAGFEALVGFSRE